MKKVLSTLRPAAAEFTSSGLQVRSRGRCFYGNTFPRPRDQPGHPGSARGSSRMDAPSREPGVRGRGGSVPATQQEPPCRRGRGRRGGCRGSRAGRRSGASSSGRSLRRTCSAGLREAARTEGTPGLRVLRVLRVGARPAAATGLGGAAGSSGWAPAVRPRRASPRCATDCGWTRSPRKCW